MDTSPLNPNRWRKDHQHEGYLTACAAGLVSFATIVTLLSSGASSAQAQSSPAVRPTGKTLAVRKNNPRWDDRGARGVITVDERAHEETRPEGIRFGNFVILPSGEVRTVFEDNVYGSQNNRVGDFSVELRPRVRALSQFSRHVLNFDFGGRFVQYANETDNNRVDGYALADGELHINHAHTITFGLVTDYTHESRLARTAPKEAAERTPIWHTGAHVGLTRDAGRLSASIGATYDSWDFEDARTSNGDTVDQDFRDATIFSSDIQLKYRFSPGYSFEAKLRGLRTLKPHIGPDQSDSWGYDITAGIRGEFSPLFHWKLVAGYGFRDFDSVELGEASGWLLEASAKYLPRRWLQFTAFARQSFDPTASATDTLVFEVGAETQIEIRRDITLTFGGTYQMANDDSELRDAERWTGLARAEYRQSKHLHWTLQFDTAIRSEDYNDWRAVDNRIWLGAKFLY